MIGTVPNKDPETQTDPAPKLRHRAAKQKQDGSVASIHVTMLPETSGGVKRSVPTQHHGENASRLKKRHRYSYGYTADPGREYILFNESSQDFTLIDRQYTEEQRGGKSRHPFAIRRRAYHKDTIYHEY
ncbi:hypothetical protein [Magnetospirillum fulvum]|uniref:hypothetical protein n=1 Tax=Magnetospirillum fulvum TaxID=1082 RepID=UPI0012DE08D1|nr:hypothetical protein [Magnetospirillum fulvum]